MYPRTIPPMCGWNIEGLNEDDRLLWQDILWKSSNYGKRVRSNVVLRSFRFSMIWALSIQYWIDHRSYQWRKSNMIPGVVQYVPLGSSVCLSFSSAVKSASSSCAGSTSVLYFLEAFPRHQKGSFRSGYDIVADATHNFSNSFGSIILVDLFICGSAMNWSASKNHHASLNLT